MNRLVLRWLVGVVALLIVIFLAERLGMTLSWDPKWHVVVFIPVLTLVNATLGSLMRLLSLPISCMTLGLFGFVINAMVFWIAGSLTGATMSFWSPLFGSICLSLISSPLSSAVIKEKRS